MTDAPRNKENIDNVSIRRYGEILTDMVRAYEKSEHYWKDTPEDKVPNFMEEMFGPPLHSLSSFQLMKKGSGYVVVDMMLGMFKPSVQMAPVTSTPNPGTPLKKTQDPKAAAVPMEIMHVGLRDAAKQLWGIFVHSGNLGEVARTDPDTPTFREEISAFIRGHGQSLAVNEYKHAVDALEKIFQKHLPTIRLELTPKNGGEKEVLIIPNEELTDRKTGLGQFLFGMFSGHQQLNMDATKILSAQVGLEKEISDGMQDFYDVVKAHLQARGKKPEDYIGMDFDREAGKKAIEASVQDVRIAATVEKVAGHPWADGFLAALPLVDKNKSYARDITSPRQMAALLYAWADRLDTDGLKLGAYQAVQAELTRSSGMEYHQLVDGLKKAAIEVGRRETMQTALEELVRDHGQVYVAAKEATQKLYAAAGVSGQDLPDDAYQLIDNEIKQRPTLPPLFTKLPLAQGR